MSHRPRLVRSVSYWTLIAGSVVAVGGGGYLLVDRLSGMDTRLLDGTATTSDVYVGQIWAIVGAILVGAGLIGLALALTLAALRSIVAPRHGAHAAPVDDAPADAEPSAREDDATAEDDFGYDAGLGYEPNEETTSLERVPADRP